MPHKHSIVYQGCLSSWDEALPLGNGHFGGMVYLTEETLVVAVNHYDVYYRILPQYSAGAREAASQKRAPDPGRYPVTIDELRRRALAAHADPDSPAHNNYNLSFSPERASSYGVDRKGSSHPLTAQIEVGFLPAALPLRGFTQTLDIGSGTYVLDEPRMTLRVFVSEDDLLVLTIEERGGAMVSWVRVCVPERRLLPRETAYRGGEPGEPPTLAFSSSFTPHGEDTSRFGPWSYGWLTRVHGAEGTVEVDPGGATFRRTAGGRAGSITAVSRALFGTTPNAAAAGLDRAALRVADVASAQRERWEAFWSRSSISLPDRFLEQLWYLGLYSLACSSGLGAELGEQACGLNGLWDIMQPSQWGSMWYWDVNIEQSFWPVYTANHLELGEAFYRGLLSSVEEARRHARDFHGLAGIAGDYPFTLYLCIWPWCCQFLAWHYAYSGDREFLELRAYPLFREVLEFFEGYLTWEPQTERFAVFPDVSPEQGPVTRNSTITVSCLRYLLRVAIEASLTLGLDPDRRERWTHILDHLPPYATEDSPRYGPHLKDSEWAEPDTYMAHSSPLMPIYPVGELVPTTADPAFLENTLRYMEKEQNLGTHNFAWLACAWARLGRGDEVLRMLYHLGVAYQLRPNGLFAEETERWMQNCLTACEPVYSPPLIEAGSATAAAVGEMLLQSYAVPGSAGERPREPRHVPVIRLFPAVPTGTLRLEADRRYDRVVGEHERSFRPWRECSFDRLLAEGAFEVSARMEGGAVSECTIRSLRGNTVRLANPFRSPLVLELRSGGHDPELPAVLHDGILTFATEAGSSYRISERSSRAAGPRAPAPREAQAPAVNTVKAPTSRRVSIGKSPVTELWRALDAATHDYYAGDQRVSPVSVHRFDFGRAGTDEAKRYEDVLSKQFHGCGKQGLDVKRVTPATPYTPALGYGWKGGASLHAADRGEPDAWRRDGVGAREPAHFLVELAAGGYRLLVVTGDAGEETHPRIRVGSAAWSAHRGIPAGEFRYPSLYLEHPGGVADIAFDAEPGAAWLVNALIVNRLP